MHQVIELVCLLALLSLGYAAAKGGPRTLRDSFIGFFWWAGIMAVLALLMSFPVAVVWCIEVGVVVAGVYALRTLWRWGYHLWLGVPGIQPVRKSQILQVCLEFDSDKRDAAKEAVAFVMRGYTMPVVLAAVVEAWRRDVAVEKMTGFLAEECDRATVSLQSLTPAFRARTGRTTRLDRPLLEELMLLYGREAVEAAGKALEKGSQRVTVHQFIRAVAARAADPERSAFLGTLGFDAPGPAAAGEERLAPAREVLFWIIAFVHPFWVYFYFRGSHRQALVWFLITGFLGYGLCVWAYWRAGEIKRALIFGITSALIGGYGVYLRFVAEQSAGWVFAAVFGVLYITALLNVGPTLERQSDSRAQAKTRGA